MCKSAMKVGEISQCLESGNNNSCGGDCDSSNSSVIVFWVLSLYTLGAVLYMFFCNDVQKLAAKDLIKLNFFKNAEGM